MPSLRIANLRIDVTEPEAELPRYLASKLGVGETEVVRWRILRKSLDARSRWDLKFVYTALVELPPFGVESLGHSICVEDESVSGPEIQ